jgi:hypothetical protein
MENKTTEEKVEEKKRLLAETENAYIITMNLYQVIVDNYKALYSANQAKVESQHMNGISQILDKVTNLIKTKKEILNEINALLDLENEEQPKTEVNKPYNKSEMMVMLKDGTKG